MQILIDILKNFKYKEGWHFSVVSERLFRIVIVCEDSEGKHKPFTHQFFDVGRDATAINELLTPGFQVQHTFSIPPFDEMRIAKIKEEALRWLLACIFQVEQHEAMEFFEYDGKKVFFPEHDIEKGSPYTVNYRG